MQKYTNNSLSQKVIVITGGAGLIGRAFTESLVNQGAVVVVTDCDEKRLSDLSDIFRGDIAYSTVKFHLMDITSKKSIVSLIQDLHGIYGKIDALVNNAYPRNPNYGRKLEDVEYDDFCENLSLHAGGYFLTSQQFGEYFTNQGYGNIVNMSSIYGVMAPRFNIYSSTNITMPVEYAVIKSGIVHLTLYLAQYFKGRNIRVNCISPGGVLAGQPEEFVNAYNMFASSKGMLDPIDICGTLIYLLSDLSCYVNGQNILVDDGWSL